MSEITVKKADAALQIVYGEVYSPDVPDSHGDFMTADDIRKMAHAFLESGRLKNIDLSHDNNLSGAYVVESFIAREDDELYIPGSWVVGVHIPDAALWKRVETGEFNGFSMEVRARSLPHELEFEVPEEITGGTDEAEGHTHTFKVMYDDEGNFLGGVTDKVDGHFHLITRGTITEKADNHAHRFSYVEMVQVLEGEDDEEAQD